MSHQLYSSNSTSSKRNNSRKSKLHNQRDSNDTNNNNNNHKESRNRRRRKRRYKQCEQFQLLSLESNNDDIISISSSSSSSLSSSSNKVTLLWQSNYTAIPYQSEEAILPILMQYGKNERGMFKYQKQYRLQKLKKVCHQYNIQIDQALSLRRQHIKKLNTYISFPKLGLGNDEDIQYNASLFEEAIHTFLKQNNIQFMDEECQRKIFVKKKNENPKLPMPPTPDCLLHETIYITKRKRSNHKKKNSQQFEVNWIDAKMFYGASTIKPGSETAVGKLFNTAEKYVSLYGPGAYVFYNGYGDRLEEQLLDKGVVLLDASPLDVRSVRQYQRTWCANESGEILP